MHYGDALFENLCILDFISLCTILVLIVFSFNESKSRANWEGFTLKWYYELFKDRHIMSALTILY